MISCRRWRTDRGVRSERWIGRADWMATNARAVGRVGTMLTEIRRAESYDLTTLSVALRQLRNLAPDVPVGVADRR